MLLLIYKPFVYDSHLSSVCLAEVVQVYGLFWEMTSGTVSVCYSPRFDSGYMFAVSLRFLLEEFHIF